jgi:hypothetical protein
MTPSSTVTAARHPCARIAENLICGVMDADMLTQRSFAAHVLMTLTLIPGEGKGRDKIRRRVKGARHRINKSLTYKV